MKTLALCLALFAISARADEFRAVVVTDSESAALRSAKTRADEAQAAFSKLREATEAKYRERLGNAYTFDWSTDFRVIAEPRSTIYSQPFAIQPQPWQPWRWSVQPTGSIFLSSPDISSHADLKPIGENWFER